MRPRVELASKLSIGNKELYFRIGRHLNADASNGQAAERHYCLAHTLYVCTEVVVVVVGVMVVVFLAVGKPVWPCS